MAVRPRAGPRSGCDRRRPASAAVRRRLHRRAAGVARGVSRGTAGPERRLPWARRPGSRVSRKPNGIHRAANWPPPRSPRPTTAHHAASSTERAARARSARASRGAPAPAPPPRAGGRPRSPAGRSRPSPSRRRISHSSRREPSLEPISVIWRAKRSIRSSSTFGPDEAPQMTRRPLFASAVERLGHRRRTDVVDDEVDAAASCQAAHLLAPAGLGVVDDAVDARGQGALALRGGRGRGDHPGARETGERDRGAPHSRSGCRHEHGLARPEAGAREQHVVRREVDRPRRGGRLVRQRCREARTGFARATTTCSA